jgi:hypothetical protein
MSGVELALAFLAGVPTLVLDVVRQVSTMSRERTMARPTGVGRAITTYSMPIEGRDEWLAAAGLRA